MPTSLGLPHIGQFVTPFDGREIVYWEDPNSLHWLSRSIGNMGFTKIVRFYEAQTDKFMCGPASVAILLNAIRMGTHHDLPIDSICEKFPRILNPDLPQDYCASFSRYTQRNIFGSTCETKTLAEVYGHPKSNGLVSPGLNLREMHDIFVAHGVHSTITYVTSDSSAEHSDNILHALCTEGQYVVANFDRVIWGLQGGGHISPLGTYDIISKKVLIVDVNMCGRWLWIDIDLLIKSMASQDNGAPRGYLIVSSQPK